MQGEPGAKSVVITVCPFGDSVRSQRATGPPGAPSGLAVRASLGRATAPRPRQGCGQNPTGSRPHLCVHALFPQLSGSMRMLRYRTALP